MDSSVISKHSELTLFTFRDGSFVIDSLHSGVRDETEKLLDEQTVRFFQELVNFERPWVPEEVEKAFHTIMNTSDKGLVTAYPIPVMPELYDPSYQPRFMVVHTISKGAFHVVEEINSSINQDGQSICILASGLGLLGMVIVLSIVWCVSRMLTQPLLWMEAVAWRIVNHADMDSGDALRVAEEGNKSVMLQCTPKTEVNQLVKEFETMIKGFSGEGASNVAQPALHEVHNDLTWHSDFQQLYSCHQNRTYRATTIGSETTDEEFSSPSDKRPSILKRPLVNKKEHDADEAMPLIVPPPVKRNQRNVICTPTDSTGKVDRDKPSLQVEICGSPLFWWIVVLIVIPLLLLIGLTCAIVSGTIVDRMPSWVDQADDASFELAVNALNLTAASKASLMSAVVFEAVRDLHLVTRVAGWLYFGGISRSSAFTELERVTDECSHDLSESCPFHNSTHSSCPCKWNELNYDNACTSFNLSNSRSMQKQFWFAQSQDADPETGKRMNSSSFPLVGNSPDTTQWWANASVLPGSDKGEQASGYSTSYDRLRVASALGVAMFPVHNYAQSLGWNILKFGLYMGFEDDGMVTGVATCRYYADFLQWNSTKQNRAAEIAPSLCPIGKYGFDPRCRDWYASGRDQYYSSDAPIHFTA